MAKTAPKKVKKRKESQSSSGIADHAIRAVLEGENVMELYNSLSDFEKSIFEEITDEIRKSGSVSELDNLWRVDYTKKPPTMHEFVDDSYYLGEVLRPREDNPGMFPPWKATLVKEFDLDSRIHNLVITGSLGGGKTFITCVIFLYRVALASMLRNPQNFFGLSKGSRIIYAILSVTRAVVAETAFGDALNFMGNSPFFVEQLRFNPAKKYADQNVNLGNGILLTAGSKGQHVLGRNCLGVAIDEGNFRLEKNPDMSAYGLYDKVRTRIKNRFQKTAGFLPAISIISSSAADESSFTERVISDINKVADTKLEQVFRVSFYKLKDPDNWRTALKELNADMEVYEPIIEKHTQKLKPRWFRAAYGIRNVDPKILTGWYDKHHNPLPGEPHEEVPPGAKIEYIPEDFVQDFRRNTRTALQDLAGISVGGSHRLFSALTDVHICIEKSKEEGCLDPRKDGVLKIPISDEDDREIWDYLEHKNFLERVNGQVRFKRHPHALRFAHVDLATKSAAGIAVSHRVGQSFIQGTSARTGKAFAEMRQIVEYDFILTIVAGDTKPISFEKIQKFFIWLKERCSIRFGKITADQFQSVQMLQMLATRGYPTAGLSLDRSKVPYYSWRQGWEEHRIRLHPQHETDMLLLEMEHLLDLPAKVDHPDTASYGPGSKDCADGACGAYYNALTFDEPDTPQDGIALQQNRPEPTGGSVVGSTVDEQAPITLDVSLARRKINRVHGA